jgi:hypothetical protein
MASPAASDQRPAGSRLGFLASYDRGTHLLGRSFLQKAVDGEDHVDAVPWIDALGSRLVGPVYSASHWAGAPHTAPRHAARDRLSD